MNWTIAVNAARKKREDMKGHFVSDFWNFWGQFFLWKIINQAMNRERKLV